MWNSRKDGFFKQTCLLKCVDPTKWIFLFLTEHQDWVVKDAKAVS